MLYIVATPIGNLSDMTFRAIEALREVDIILCEDTRMSQRLLNHYKIDNKKLISYHQHTKEGKEGYIVDLISDNKVALITDAGTPTISDPGCRLVARVRESCPQVDIIPIPGPSAVITALSVSGMPTDSFVFLGFIPHKNKRQKFLREVVGENRTVIFYESCHRIIKCLTELEKIAIEENQDKQVFVAREMTKKFETFYLGSPEEVKKKVGEDKVKGEYVVIVA